MTIRDLIILIDNIISAKMYTTNVSYGFYGNNLRKKDIIYHCEENSVYFPVIGINHNKESLEIIIGEDFIRILIHDPYNLDDASKDSIFDINPMNYNSLSNKFTDDPLVDCLVHGRKINDEIPEKYSKILSFAKEYMEK